MKQNKELEGGKLLRIGELARLTGETTPTLNFWTNLGILKCSDKTPKGYRLYSPDTVKQIKEIRMLKKRKRLTLEELRERYQSK